MSRNYIYTILLVISLPLVYYVVCVFTYHFINLIITTIICTCIDAVQRFHMVTGIRIEGSGIGIGDSYHILCIIMIYLLDGCEDVCIITHASLFRGGEDHVCESPLGDSCFVMNIHNPFMHCVTSQYVFKLRDVIMLLHAVTIVAA